MHTISEVWVAENFAPFVGYAAEPKSFGEMYFKNDFYELHE